MSDSVRRRSRNAFTDTTQVSLPRSPADITASWWSKVLHTARPGDQIPHAKMTPLSIYFLFDEKCLCRAHLDCTLDMHANVVRWLGVDDLHRAVLGHLEHARCLQLAHGVPLAQIRVDFDSVAAHISS